MKGQCSFLQTDQNLPQNYTEKMDGWTDAWMDGRNKEEALLDGIIRSTDINKEIPFPGCFIN